MTELLAPSVRRRFCQLFVDTLQSLVTEATDPQKVMQARCQFESLPERIRECEDYHTQIMIHPSNATKQEQLYSEYDDFMESVRLIQAAFKQPPFYEQPPLDTSAANTAFISQTSSQSYMHAKLPKLDLPHFYGEIANWNSFFDIYCSSVHDNDSLRPVQKFQYLKSIVKGEPLALIKNLSLTDDNYSIAIKLLTDRYAQRRLISSYHIQTLIELPKPIPMTYDHATKFIAAIREHTEALRANHEPVDEWSPVLTFILLTKLDTKIRNSFERNLSKDNLPTLADFLGFLDKFIQSQQWQCVHKTPTQAEPSRFKSDHRNSTSFKRNRTPFNTSSFVSTANTSKCIACSYPHALYKCFKFKSMEPSKRFEMIRTNNCCHNCLSSLHVTPNCRSTMNCRNCNERHHTLLHFGRDESSTNASNIPQVIDKAINCNPSTSTAMIAGTTRTSSLSHSPAFSVVILGTAIVRIQDSLGSWQPVRALLDSGSESSYITEKCSSRLQLPTYPANIVVSGFGNATVPNNVRGTTTLRLCSSHNDSSSYTLSVIIVSQIIQDLPKAQLSSDLLRQFTHLQLADPEFVTPAPVDLLIGADLYFNLLTGHKQTIINGPNAIETSLGWIVSGSLSSLAASTVNTCLTVQNPISTALSKFWELEDVSTSNTLSKSDQLATDIFSSQHRRLESGRYMVPLLFKEYPPKLGNSYTNALRCFNILQRRLSSDSQLQLEYRKFMADYSEQNHMSLIDSSSNQIQNGFYLPHHGVLRETNSTIKLRVVFNGSKKTSSNKSLNDYLLSGPALQAVLTSIIHRSRLHKIIFTADIRQMYRQILISDEHRIYQKILWSSNSSTQPQTYMLNTVTYGTTCAPYLAIRTLHQLADDEESKFPRAAQTLKSDTYVDDIISGANSVKEALDLQQEIIKLLNTAGLELRKWTSNHPDLLQNIPEEHREFSFLQEEHHTESVKILGLSWNPFLDFYSYKISLPNHSITKRTILSDIARIFDPTGWLSPVIMTAKCIMQQLWISGSDWDAPVPESLSTQWETFKLDLLKLSTLTIPRHIDTINGILSLIGFCDASEAGYAAVVYIHTEHLCSHDCRTYLVASKTKVAPLKKISLPRLELCAALLLSRLMRYLLDTVTVSFANISAWSDSTITLSWVRAPPYKWKTFVSNRVSEIQQNLPQNMWHHISSEDNPADCASRGISVPTLLSHTLWWEGPSWLRTPSSAWPLQQQEEPSSNSLELEELKISLLVDNEPDYTLLHQYSNLNHLLRITALCTRFYKRLKTKEAISSPALLASELDNALITWVKITQREAFADDIARLENGTFCSKPIQQLSPFIDESGLLRVGGRIRNSSLSVSHKHPILLPSHHRLTDLVIDYYHQKYLHPSPRTLQAILNRRFWIVGARRLIRSYSLKCIKCFRCHPIGINPNMGNLPEHRVTQLKPFDVVGIDYGGPFYITPDTRRGCKSIKSYLCLFVCFATKAVHLELALHLTTEAFILAFRRFLSRRGRCTHIYSDSGTNFVGAKTYFTELQQFIASTRYNDYLSNKLAADGIQWHFNPPSAPHFGGIWEAGIKSVKFHTSRVIGSQILSIDEFNTLLCQIESILNSRPLYPLSSDPNDLHALTPNHFLMLEAAVCLPDHKYRETNTNLLRRWHLLQNVLNSFWKRWHSEYLNTLQQRQKWTRSTVNLQPDQLVIIKNDLLPPLQWKLARIIKVHPGEDNVARVAQVRTASGVLTRPIVNLCPLPES